MVERIGGRYPLGGVKGQHLVEKIQWNIRYHTVKQEGERREREST